MFAGLKKESKALGLKCRLINNRTELIREITPKPETMNTRTAQKLYNRFSRLRHGGNYPSTKDKPEKFSAARVAELLAKEKPQTQQEWLRLVGCQVKHWRLYVYEQDWGGGGCEALLMSVDGVVFQITYVDVENANYLWTQSPGFADSLIGKAEIELVYFANGFFEWGEHNASMMLYSGSKKVAVFKSAQLDTLTFA